ncbi:MULTISPECIES: hypothetical protein [Xenorhabdus]|uniref:hypothetical protein n=1 Tax=Xenorhabdus TaxID=626 RepID=UPI00064B39B0|nr:MULTISPECIES: hypothetical protein [Xenorhabdus]KLU14170.1 hypothetical protein AAY47_17915 [Xenorhabdus griffiniae]KOP32971.1 hypothetical protein AFK69_13100 [Xenorhabdus sp. GDc328]
MSDLNLVLPYYPLDLAVKTINCTEMELLLLAQTDAIKFHLYPDPTCGLIEWDSVSCLEIGAILLRNKKVSEVIKKCVSEVGIEIELTDLVITQEELIKAYNILNNSSVEKPAPRIKETAKQSRVIVDLLESHGLTGEDFKGSIGSLRQKIARIPKIKSFTNLDDKTISKWLKQANVRPE